jgi:Domain of Unknown Function (DUF928)
MLIMNKSLFSVCCVLSIVVGGLMLSGGPIAAKSLIKFRPPSRGTVSTTTGGASRSGPKTAKNGIIALLPEKALGGLTISKQPVLWLSLNNVQADKMVVEVLENGKKFASSTATMPVSNGLVRINLTGPTGPELKVGDKYKYSWSVTFPCESGLNCQQGEESPEVTGWITRSTLNARQEKAIGQATTPREKAAIYAEAGIWYDSIATLSTLRGENPQDKAIQADWESLLESAGLADQAKTPLAECCQMQPR